jgi:hypothetical protein
VDVIKLSAALANAATTDEQTVVVKASQVSGESIAIIGTLGDKGAGTVADDNVTVKADQTTIDLGTLNIDSTTIEAVSIDLTSVQAASVNITGSNISESLSNVLTGAITIDGKGGADVITTGSGADNITSGEGGDTITGGLGADTIILTEATAATDTVVLTTGGALDLVTITGFSVAATNGDNLDISLADLNAIVTDMNTADAGTALATATGATLTVVEAGAYDLAGAASDMLVLDGDFVDGVAVATALEVNGDYALKVNGTVTAGDAFLIAYDNGTATNIAYVTSTAGAADDAAFATGDLTVTDFVTFTDIADATTILSANVDIVT